MEIVKFRKVFDRRNESSQTKKASVLIEVTYGGKRKWYNTGVKLLKNQWDSRRSIVVRCSNRNELNRMIDTLYRKIFEIAESVGHENFSFEYLDNSLLSPREINIDFFKFSEDVIDKLDIRPITKRQYKVVLKSLKQFGKINYLKDITYENIVSYDHYIRTERRLKRNQSIVSYHAKLKSIINIAIKYGYLNSNPYSKTKFTYKKEQSIIKYLNEEEISMLKSCNPKQEYLKKALDLFTVQMYTGLSYSDLYHIDFKNMEKDVNGRFIVKDKRLKTNEDYYILILPMVEEILTRYDFCLPKFSCQKYNSYLKILGCMAGIEKHITSHVARHTFATTITLSNNVPIEIVSKMLGHSNINMTQRYAKVVANNVIVEYERLGRILK